MKITYDMQEDEQREIVAFIDGYGELCIKGDAGQSIMINEHGVYKGAFNFHEWMDQCEVVKIFYRGSGDSVTITF